MTSSHPSNQEIEMQAVVIEKNKTAIEFKNFAMALTRPVGEHCTVGRGIEDVEGLFSSMVWALRMSIEDVY